MTDLHVLFAPSEPKGLRRTFGSVHGSLGASAREPNRSHRSLRQGPQRTVVRGIGGYLTSHVSKAQPLLDTSNILLIATEPAQCRVVEDRDELARVL
jgi:hypothetical protein